MSQLVNVRRAAGEERGEMRGREEKWGGKGLGGGKEEGGRNNKRPNQIEQDSEINPETGRNWDNAGLNLPSSQISANKILIFDLLPPNKSECPLHNSASETAPP